MAPAFWLVASHNIARALRANAIPWADLAAKRWNQPLDTEL